MFPHKLHGFSSFGLGANVHYGTDIIEMTVFQLF